MRALRALVGRAGVLGVVVALFVLWGAAAASAHSHYIPTGSMGVAGEGAGELSLSRTGRTHGDGNYIEVFEPADGVAVSSSTHDVYVADTGNDRVDESEADGTFVRAWGWGLATGLAAPQTCTLTCHKGIAGSGA